MLKLTVFIFVGAAVIADGYHPWPSNKRDLTSVGTGLDGRIVGGKKTTIEEHPWQLSLLSKGKHLCGAIVISPNWALTTANCRLARQLSIYAGSSYTIRNGTRYAISEIISHPNFDSSTNDYDIALIKMSEPFDLSTNRVKAVKLPPEDSSPEVGTIMNVTGWGQIKDGSKPLLLQVVDVPTVSLEDCKKALHEYTVTERMLCAGHERGGKDSCFGDAGGPLVNNGVLYGIVSWGKGCATRGLPGVYAHVGVLRSWIKQISGV